MNRLFCSACGVGADTSPCDCDAPLIKVGTHIAAVITKNPEKSNREIAAEAGIDETIVRRMRQKSFFEFAGNNDD
jgi:hypothetical protein